MDRLKLTLFGPFEARLNEKRITEFATDKVRALLVYLALEGNRPHRRETLATLLWGDWPHAVALRNLRQSLHRLRQTLDQHQSDLSNDLLTITRQTVQLNPEYLDLDVTHFQQLAREIEQHSHDNVQSCEACLAILADAVALYQGELMTGFSLPDAPDFENWLLIQREQFHHQTLAALEDLALAAEAKTDYQQAQRYTTRQLGLEPWREEAHRQMMRLLAYGGQRSEALAQYELCRQVLAEELAVEPSLETTALYETIQADELQKLVHHAPKPPTTPAPASSPIRLYHFPNQLSPFVGRRIELQQITRQLVEPDCRLLTLTGPGGVGKTRLAIETAQQIKVEGPDFDDGIYFVPLTGVSSSDLLVPTLGTALGLTFSERETPQVQLLQFLAQRSLLLILDNFEHLLTGVDLLSELLQEASHVKLLVTSREPLNMQRERRVLVEGLGYSETTEFDPAEATQLFIQAAQHIQPDFQLTPQEHLWVTQICQRLQGIPLALEIAATWLRMYDLEKIAHEVISNLDLLVTPIRDLPERHRSLRAVFEQTWRLLSETEQRLLAQATVFRGGFDTTALLTVTKAHPIDLASLGDKSLLQLNKTARYTIHELLRQFAAEKLGQWSVGDEALESATFAQHSRYYLELVEQRQPELRNAGAQAALRTLQPDFDNVRAAWQWAAEQGVAGLLIRGNKGIHTFYEITGRYEEGEAMFRTAAHDISARLKETQPDQQADLAEALCWLLQRQAQFLVHLGQIDRALAICDSIFSLADQFDCVGVRYHTLIVYGHIYRLQGEYDAAEPVLTQALTFFEVEQNVEGQAGALFELGSISWQSGQFDRALSYYQASLNLSHARQNLYNVSNCAGNIGSVYWFGYYDYEQALHWYQEALEVSQTLGYQADTARWLGNTGLVYWKWGDYERSLSFQQQALEMKQQMGDKFRIAIDLGNIGLLYADMGDDERALNYYDQALPMHQRTGAKFYRAEILQAKAELLFRQADYNTAQMVNAEAIHLAAQIQGTVILFEGQLLAAKLTAKLGEPAKAIQHLQAMLSGTKDEAEQAALHYELWHLTQQRNHGQTALTLYQRLAGYRQDIQFQVRLRELRASTRRDDIDIPANLPRLNTPFIGRTKELGEISHLLESPNCQLVTLLGPGGIGKTRLALQTGLIAVETRQFRDGVYFVPLSGLTAIERLSATIAEVLGISLYGDVEPQSKLLDDLRAKELLLILDNVEHLLSTPDQPNEGVTYLLAEILQQAPAIKILVTSRVRLHVPGEWVLDVAGLAFPHSTNWHQATEDIENYSAAQLFIQAASRVRPNFVLSAEDRQAVARICDLVEGLPLALELAASWSRSLSCQEIADEIEQDFEVLTTASQTVPERHRSLRAVFDYAWRILSKEERAVVRQLSVFRGGFSREAAQQVTGTSLGLLAVLVDKSFVRLSSSGRYFVHELLRQYAQSKLEAQPAEALQTCNRHSAYFGEFLAHHFIQQKEILEAVDAELANVRVAWQWAIDNQRYEAIVQGLNGLWGYLDARGYFQEGETRFGQAAAAFKHLIDPDQPLKNQQHVAILARLLSRQAWFSIRLGLYSAAQRLLNEGLAMLQTLNSPQFFVEELELRYMLGLTGWFTGDYEAGLANLEKTLPTAVEANAHLMVGGIAAALGVISHSLGRLDDAQRYHEQSFAAYQTVNDWRGIAIEQACLGGIYTLQGKLAQAQTLLEDGLTMAQTMNAPFALVMGHYHMGKWATASHNLTQAQASFRETARVAKGVGDKHGYSLALVELATIHTQLEEFEAATTALHTGVNLALTYELYPTVLEGLVNLVQLAKASDTLPPPLQTQATLTVVLNHPASRADTQQKAQQLLAQLGLEVSAEPVALTIEALVEQWVG